ncbi:MAG: hypothetical protein PsegKO_26670 [Pseudohongiellaceae bacterium]
MKRLVVLISLRPSVGWGGEGAELAAALEATDLRGGVHYNSVHRMIVLSEKSASPFFSARESILDSHCSFNCGWPNNSAIINVK